MPIVHECSAPGCPVLTMGLFCVEHEALLAEEELASELRALTLVAAAASGDAAAATPVSPR